MPSGDRSIVVPPIASALGLVVFVWGSAAGYAALLALAGFIARALFRGVGQPRRVMATERVQSDDLEPEPPYAFVAPSLYYAFRARALARERSE